MSHAANTSIQDTQNGIGDFTLLPEADRNSLDDYMKLPEQNRLNTCSHAHSSRRHSTHPGHRRQASSKRGKQLSVNQPLTDSEAKKIFINGAEDFYSLSANPQFSNVAELFDAWLTEHDRQLLAKTETEAGKRISSELKLEHASDAHARTEPSRAYIQGCKAARSLLEDAIRDLTQEQGTL